MPWRGLEPRRLAAPPPQDVVSTNFTTRASYVVLGFILRRPWGTVPAMVTGPTGLEPATSRVTVECSNQTELRPLGADSRYDTACAVLHPAVLPLHAAARRALHDSAYGSRTRLCTVKGCRPEPIDERAPDPAGHRAAGNSGNGIRTRV